MAAAAIVNARPEGKQTPSLWPREHGAWSLLGVPFVGAAILARQADWLLLPTAVCALAIFLLREPLIALGRQRFVWRTPHPEAQDAQRWVLILSLILALAGPLLLFRWSLLYWLAFGAIGLGWTALAAWLAVRNKQRSLVLQMASSCGLTATALAASLSITGDIQPWAWALWAFTSLHALGAVLVVRALLEAKQNARARTPQPATLRKAAVWGNLPLLAAAVALAGTGHWLLAAACLAEGVHHLLMLRRLESYLDTPLKSIGLRAMTHSMIFTALVIAAVT